MPTRQPKPAEFRFKIDVFTKATLPMARLAEYMASFALLCGETAHVHFERLAAGSVDLVSVVETPAVPKVAERVQRVRFRDDPPEDALMAYKDINIKLRQDNAVGTLSSRTNGRRHNVLSFPGRNAPPAETFTFSQDGSLDGVPILVGGKGKEVSVHLRSGEVVHTSCRAEQGVAKQLAEYLFTREVRVFGQGRWYRNEDGNWELKHFKISRFDPLDETPLSVVVESLKAIPGSEWGTISDPWSELEKIRRGDDGG